MNSRKSYKERLPTEEKIKESLDRYFGFMHSKINALGNLDFSRMMKMQNKGWHMESTKDEIEQLIDDFVNTYGFIYKEGEDSPSRVLIRGTTTDEAQGIRKGKEIPIILSTTTDEGIAKRFCEYGKAALIRIRTGNSLPHLYVEQLKDENSGNEEEVLILPFARVKDMSFTSDWQGYKYYDMTLEKGELPEISDEELEEKRKQCIEGYDDFIKKSKEYEDLYFEYEKMSRLRANRDEQEKIYAKIESLREQVHNYRTLFQEMLKGLCRQREKDVDLEKEEKTNAIIEEIKKTEAERIEKLRKEIEEFKKSLSEDSEFIKNGTKSNVSSFVTIINRYRNMSNTLGIETFNSQNLEYDLQSRARQIEEGLQREVISQYPDTEYGILKDMVSQYGTAKDLLQEMPELLKNYNENSMLDLKLNLNQKVQEVIYKTTYDRLNNEKQIAISQKDTLLNKILGKTKLNQAKVRNINARIDYASKRRETDSSSNSVRRMLASMYECAYTFNGGNLTPEMIEIEEAIRKVFTNIPDKELLVQNASIDKLKVLPALTSRKRVFFRLRNIQEARRLENETVELDKETKNMRTSAAQIPNTNVNLTNIYSRYNGILDRVRQLVSEDDEQEIQPSKYLGDD